MFVTRPFDVAVTPDVVVWPLDGTAAGPRSFTVTVTNRTRGPASTKAVLTPPPGWGGGGAVPSESLSFQREDEAKSFTVTLALPASARPGVYQVKAAAGADRERSAGWPAVIRRPDIPARGVTAT